MSRISGISVFRECFLIVLNQFLKKQASLLTWIKEFEMLSRVQMTCLMREQYLIVVLPMLWERISGEKKRWPRIVSMALVMPWLAYSRGMMMLYCTWGIARSHRLRAGT